MTGDFSALNLETQRQISRADSGYLALQDATTGKLFLRGAGTDERVSMYNLPVTEAASVCPSSVLLHVAHSRKVSLDSIILSLTF
jgi:hypothetical protein